MDIGKSPFGYSPFGKQVKRGISLCKIQLITKVTNSYRFVTFIDNRI